MQNELPGICFAGCGHIAALHAKNIRKAFKNIDLFFTDTNNKNAIELKTKFGGKKTFPQIEYALDSPDVDIVFITTPHAFHAEIAVAAARAGKDIILEKPIARKMSEVRNIQEAVRKYNVRCTVAENYLYKPFIPKIKNSINQGLIGSPLFIEVNKYNKDNIKGWRADPDMMGGGALLEGGVHWVNLLVTLAGSTPVSAMAYKPKIEYQTNVPFEDSLTVMVNFENGMVGKLFHSWHIKNRFKGVGLSKIFGTDGVITFESNGLFTSVYGTKKKKFFTKLSDFLGYKAMIKSFIDDYVENKPWNPSLDQIVTEFKVVEAAYKSLKTGVPEIID